VNLLSPDEQMRLTGASGFPRGALLLSPRQRRSFSRLLRKRSEKEGPRGRYRPPMRQTAGPGRVAEGPAGKDAPAGSCSPFALSALCTSAPTATVTTRSRSSCRRTPRNPCTRRTSSTFRPTSRRENGGAEPDAMTSGERRSKPPFFILAC
jgi:hypothetical protein